MGGEGRRPGQTWPGGPEEGVATGPGSLAPAGCPLISSTRLPDLPCCVVPTSSELAGGTQVTRARALGRQPRTASLAPRLTHSSGAAHTLTGPLIHSFTSHSFIYRTAGGPCSLTNQNLNPGPPPPSPDLSRLCDSHEPLLLWASLSSSGKGAS